MSKVLSSRILMHFARPWLGLAACRQSIGTLKMESGRTKFTHCAGNHPHEVTSLEPRQVQRNEWKSATKSDLTMNIHNPYVPATVQRRPQSMRRIKIQVKLLAGLTLSANVFGLRLGEITCASIFDTPHVLRHIISSDHSPMSPWVIYLVGWVVDSAVADTNLARLVYFEHKQEEYPRLIIIMVCYSVMLTLHYYSSV